MLMVIIGAGASFDSSADHRASTYSLKRPPLANDLFHHRYGRFRAQFPQFQGVLAELVPKAGRSVEDVLQRLQGESGANPMRHQQLAAIRYYLRSLLSVVPAEWLSVVGGFTNYNALLDQINNHRKGSEPVCLVTFNYDTLLETALAKECGMSWDVMDDYISHTEFKLFKLHGSTNWGREIHSLPTGLRTAGPEDLIPLASRLGISDQFASIPAPGASVSRYRNSGYRKERVRVSGESRSRAE